MHVGWRNYCFSKESRNKNNGSAFCQRAGHRTEQSNFKITDLSDRSFFKQTVCLEQDSRYRFTPVIEDLWRWELPSRWWNGGVDESVEGHRNGFLG